MYCLLAISYIIFPCSCLLPYPLSTSHCDVGRLADNFDNELRQKIEPEMISTNRASGVRLLIIIPFWKRNGPTSQTHRYVVTYRLFKPSEIV